MEYSKEEVYLAAIKSDLKVFLRQAFNTIYPGKEFIDNWHIDAVIYCLEQSIQGEMPRLIINMPPRQLKSFIVSVALPAFILGSDPTAKIICVSYSDDLARMLARDFRRIIESEWYKKLFPHIKPVKMTENEFVTDAGGYRYATSVGGTLTGKGGDFIIIDDPLKPEEALSDKARQASNNWYRSTLLSRLDDKNHSVLILVMQRLHVNDLTGFIEGCGGFHKLSLPAIARQDEYIPINSKEKYFRKPGTPLHQDREGLDVLERMRNEMGSYNFQSQYQQSPEAPEGGMIKPKWINIITQRPQFSHEGQLFVSIDTALSTSETADYSAISVIYATHQIYTVIYSERGRWDYETLREKALSYTKKFNIKISFFVEAAGVGISLVHFLRASGYSCFHYHPKDGKMTRVAYAVPIIHEGRLFILNEAGNNAWVEPYINELISFPHGRFDDQVDSLVQLITSLEGRIINMKIYA